MKEFEKHLTKDYPYVRPTSIDAEIMRQEWRACIKWFEEAINSCMAVGDVQGIIDAELEEE